MEAGTTFLMKGHLWIILSDPKADSDNILLVNLTTLDERKENVCIVDHGEHPWVTHKSCVNYGDSIVTTLKKLYDAKDGGAIVLQEPVSPMLLKRMREAAAESERMSLEHADILSNQGLIDF